MSSRVQCRLDPAPQAAAEGRAFVEDALRAWGLTELCDDAALVTSELVANAVLHTQEPFMLCVVRSTDGVRIEVSDRSPVAPMRRDTAPLEPGGLGLVLVENIARSWGSDQRPPGKTVWAELAR